MNMCLDIITYDTSENIYLYFNINDNYRHQVFSCLTQIAIIKMITFIFYFIFQLIIKKYG